MTIIDKLQTTGYRRLGRAKTGFRYRDARGHRLKAVEIERIEALKIPPAWADVAINPSAVGSVQAVGKDAAGRWQYHYHERQVARRERIKRERLIRFIGALPRMRRIVSRDLGRPGIPRERVLAGIVRILSTCFLRPGSEVYATENGSFGIATLRPRHVRVRGEVVAFDFRGKSGQRQIREVRDRRVARLIRDMLEHKGEVFKFRNEEGTISDVKSRHINAYIQQNMGVRFSAKDFRTWAGTLLCASMLARTAPESRASRTARKRSIAAAIRQVAEHLGNTPAVCRSSYVFPIVLQRFEEGHVVRHAFNGDTRRLQEVERCERSLLALLGAPSARGGVERTPKSGVSGTNVGAVPGGAAP